jgi:hypothetical protein
VVDLAVPVVGCGSAFPSLRTDEDVGVRFALEGGLGPLVLLQIVEASEEEEPGGLLGVVELTGAVGFFQRMSLNPEMPEDAIVQAATTVSGPPEPMLEQNNR